MTKKNHHLLVSSTSVIQPNSLSLAHGLAQKFTILRKKNVERMQENRNNISIFSNISLKKNKIKTTTTQHSFFFFKQQMGWLTAQGFHPSLMNSISTFKTMDWWLSFLHTLREGNECQAGCHSWREVEDVGLLSYWISSTIMLAVRLQFCFCFLYLLVDKKEKPQPEILVWVNTFITLLAKNIISVHFE